MALSVEPRDVSLTGWIGEHPDDGSDVAHLLLHPSAGRGIAEGLELLGQTLGLASATAGRMPQPPPEIVCVDLTPNTAIVRIGPDWHVEIPVHREWAAAVRAQGFVVLSVAFDPLPLPGMAGLDAVTSRADRLMTGLIRAT